MSERNFVAAFDYSEGGVEDVLEFLKRMRDDLRTLRMVRVWTDRLQIFDVNGDYFEVRGLGYPHSDVSKVLQAIGTAFKPEFIHNPINQPFKEFKTGRQRPWAEDRIM